MLLVLSIFPNEMVFDNGSVLYCLTKTKYFLSSQSSSSSRGIVILN